MLSVRVALVATSNARDACLMALRTLVPPKRVRLLRPRLPASPLPCPGATPVPQGDGPTCSWPALACPHPPAPTHHPSPSNACA